VEQFKHAIVYGKSVKHQPQRVGLAHELADEDIGMYHFTTYVCHWDTSTDAPTSDHRETVDDVL